MKPGSLSTSPSPGGGITPLQQMLASGTGAILTSLFVTPLDVVKIRLQAQRTPFSKGNPAQGRVGVSGQPPTPPVSQRAAHVDVSVETLCALPPSLRGQ
uniref:Mitochondrial glutathione transporter SLC25A39 n=1 Tax=Buteo japonicus TaxID=224669 RepID=A0A8C0AV88_9AVES